MARRITGLTLLLALAAALRGAAGPGGPEGGNDADARATAPLGSLRNGLVAMYTFDAVVDLAVPDESGRGSDARLIAAIPESEGVLGTALQFDGRERHMMVDGAVIGGRRNFSVSFWVRTTENRKAESPPECPTLLGLATRGLGSGDFGIVSNGGVLVFWEGLNGHDRGHSSRRVISDDKWHHVALVCDEDRGITIHLDGEAVIKTRPPVRGLSRATFAVGGCLFHGEYRHHHRALIDELMLWERPLTPLEISRLRALRYR